MTNISLLLVLDLPDSISQMKTSNKFNRSIQVAPMGKFIEFLACLVCWAEGKGVSGQTWKPFPGAESIRGRRGGEGGAFHCFFGFFVWFV